MVGLRYAGTEAFDSMGMAWVSTWLAAVARLGPGRSFGAGLASF